MFFNNYRSLLLHFAYQEVLEKIKNKEILLQDSIANSANCHKEILGFISEVIDMQIMNLKREDIRQLS